MPQQTFQIAAGADDKRAGRTGATYPPTGAFNHDSTLSVDTVARLLSGGTYETTCVQFKVQGDPSTAGGVGFQACPRLSTVAEMESIVNSDLYECTVAEMR
jgi:hypothetical protein